MENGGEGSAGCRSRGTKLTAVGKTTTAFPPSSVASPEHPVDHYGKKNDGLEGSLVCINRAALIYYELISWYYCSAYNYYFRNAFNSGTPPTQMFHVLRVNNGKVKLHLCYLNTYSQTKAGCPGSTASAC